VSLLFHFPFEMYKSYNLIYSILQFYARRLTYLKVVVTSKEGKRAKAGRPPIVSTGNVGKSGTRSD